MRTFFLLLIACLMTSGCVASIPKEALLLPENSLADRQMQTRRFDTANNSAMLNAAAATLQDIGFTLDESEFTLGVLVASKQRDATSAGQVAGAVLLAALTGAVTHVDKDQIIRVSLVMRDIPGAEEKSAPPTTALTPTELASINSSVVKAVADGLRKKYPNEVSERIASKIAQDTAATLTTDLMKLAKVSTDGGQSTVRVTFQRLVLNTAGQITSAEQINDVEVYQEFFDKLSKAVFLEAHAI